MIDDVDAFRQSAEILKERYIYKNSNYRDQKLFYKFNFNAKQKRGAYKVYVMATHGLLSSDAPRLIDNSSIDEVVVTNTVPHEVQKMQCHRIKTVDISLLISEAIRRIHNQESMSYLFRDITAED